METALRQSLKMSLGDMTTFFTRPISATIMGAVIIIFMWPLVNRFVIQRFVGKVEIPTGEAI